MAEHRISTVGVVGAGTMGADIAQSAIRGGYTVRLFDTADGARDQASAKIRKSLERDVQKQRLDESEAETIFGRLQTVDSLEALSDCELIIEAIVEVFESKCSLFESLSKTAESEAIVATNTSSLRVSDLAEHISNPQRVIGLHYFFPAAVNPLLEVIRGERSANEAIDQALEFARRTKKQPVLCRDVYGFAVNRYFVPYLNEAARLAGEGFDQGAVEQCALDELQAAVGPFKVMDLTKTIIAVHAARTLEQLNDFYTPCRTLVEQGESGENWAVTADPEAAPDTLSQARARLLGAIFLAVLEELDQDVASPGDIDLGARIALQWGRQPCELMDELGREAVESLIQPFVERYAVPAPASVSRVGSLRS